MRNIINWFKNILKNKQNFLEIFGTPSGFEPAAILRDLHASKLAGKILVENARICALWASFNQNGALHSTHLNTPLLMVNYCPHYIDALPHIGPKPEPIGSL